MFTTEFKLLLELCRRNFPGGARERVDELGAAADWQRLVRLARFHRVQGLIAQALHHADVAQPGARAELSADAKSIAATSLRQLDESSQILSIAGAEGIPILFLKGLTVGALAYGNSAVKMGWDIDLLVDPDDLRRAAELLRSRGFRLTIPRAGEKLASWHGRRKESLWSQPSGGMHVELHTRLADNRCLISGIGVNSPRQDVAVAPGIALPTLAPDELFAYLCVHGASSAWFRLKWITDLAALLHGRPAGEVERLYGRSQQLGAARAASQALLVADALYGTLSGSALRQSLRKDRASRWLAAAALAQLAGKAEPVEPTSKALGTWRIHLTQLTLRPGVHFPFEEFSRQLRDAIT